jgi:hypothetical protein
MAYPTISAPYGFKPINRYDGMPYAGATRQLPLATGTAIYFGQPLTAGAKLGVFVGCQYTNSSGQTVQAQYYPGTGVTNAIAYVVDDPVAVFKVAVTDAGGAIATVTQAAVGTNVTALANTPSATTGDAATSILSTSPAADATFPFRVIDVVKDTAVTATTFCEVIVKINLHQYNTALGNAVA